MTNKINGIDVSECKYYHCKGCTANNFGKCDSSSEIYKNCYFKQLKRLQEENEKLKEKIKDLDAMTGIFSVRLANKYKQALEKIQKMFSCPCVEGENCFTCNSKCSNKDVLNITVEVLNG